MGRFDTVSRGGREDSSVVLKSFVSPVRSRSRPARTHICWLRHGVQVRKQDGGRSQRC
jgi:hypothetical protein